MTYFVASRPRRPHLLVWWSVVALALSACETVPPDPVLIPDLPDSSGRLIRVEDGVAMANTRDGPARFATTYYSLPITVTPMDERGNPVTAALDVYLFEGGDGEVAIWVLDSSADPAYTPFYFRGRLDVLALGPLTVEPRLVCGGLCLGALVIAIGSAQVVGIMAAAKHDIEAVTELTDAKSTSSGTWYRYCKTIPEVAAMVNGIHTMENLPREIATKTAVSLVMGYFSSALAAGDLAQYSTMIRTMQGAVDTGDVVLTTVGAFDAAELTLSLMNAVDEDYGTEVEWDVGVFVANDEGKFGWRHREFHVYGPCASGIADRWTASLTIIGPQPTQDDAGFTIEMTWDATLPALFRPLLHVAYLDAVGGFVSSEKYFADLTEPGRAVFTVPTRGAHQLIASGHVGVSTNRRDVTGRVSVLLGDFARDAPRITSASVSPRLASVFEPVTVTFAIEADVGRATTCEVDFGDGHTELITACGSGAATHAYTTRASHTIRVAAFYADAAGTRSVTEFRVEVGDRRDQLLAECGQWSASIEGGGAGLTSDTWDVTALPIGAVLDLEFDAFSVPDRFQVRLDDRFILYDSGWRGAGAGPSAELVEGAAVMDGWEAIQVYVDGSAPSTAWRYRLRCRTP